MSELPPLPRSLNPHPHCKVAVVIGTETNFELLLPEDWNGKFVMGGGAGLCVTDLSDGRILLAVVDSNREPWQVFYIENSDRETGEVIRNEFEKAGTWQRGNNADIGSTVFSFLAMAVMSITEPCSHQISEGIVVEYSLSQLNKILANI